MRGDEAYSWWSTLRAPSFFVVGIVLIGLLLSAAQDATAITMSKQANGLCAQKKFSQDKKLTYPAKEKKQGKLTGKVGVEGAPCYEQRDGKFLVKGKCSAYGKCKAYAYKDAAGKWQQISDPKNAATNALNPKQPSQQKAPNAKASYYDWKGCGSFGLGPGGTCKGGDPLRPGDVAVPPGSGYKPNEIIDVTFCGTRGCHTYPMRVHDLCPDCAGKDVAIGVWGPVMRAQVKADTGYNFAQHGFAPITITRRTR